MSVAFTCRKRRDGGVPVEALADGTICLDERVEYVFSFTAPCQEDVRARIAELGGELVAPDVAVLGFRNFVGRARLAGVTIEIISNKLGAGGASRLLQDVSDLSAELVFGWRSPVGLAAQASPSSLSPVPYHQLQVLRHAMMVEAVGERLQDWLSVIARAPTRRFAQDRPIVPLDRVRRLDGQAVLDIFSRLDRLVPVEVGSPAATSPIAQALRFGTPARLHMPESVAAPRGYLSFDTPENRFVRHVVSECTGLAHRFMDDPRLHASLRRDCRDMAGMLEEAAAASHLLEAGQLTAAVSPTQALLKSEGYREILTFWDSLGHHAALPLSNEETTRLLEGKDIATLYEYWVFVRVLAAACEVTGQRPIGPPRIDRNDLGTSLVVGLRNPLGPDLAVRYNPTFTRAAGRAYSTPLRPDVVVEVGDRLHAFDAKYRLDRLDVTDGDSDDGSSTYKRADLYKMHTYRDAIRGMRTAFVVYPGHEAVFFAREGGGPGRLQDLTQDADGVGVIPLRPSEEDPSIVLRETLAGLLKPPGEGLCVIA